MAAGKKTSVSRELEALVELSETTVTGKGNGDACFSRGIDSHKANHLMKPNSNKAAGGRVQRQLWRLWDNEI